MSGKTGIVLAKATFPLYTVQSLSRNRILIGGGGGTAKTGVPNAFEIYEVSSDCSATRKLVALNTEDAVMSCAAIDASDKVHVFCTEGDAWRNYNLLLNKQASVQPTHKEEEEREEDDNPASKSSQTADGAELRERRKNDNAAKSDKETIINDKHESIENDPNILELCSGWKANLNIGKLMSCEFEIEKDHFYHSALLFSRDNNSVVTGSSDGKIRIWPLSPTDGAILDTKIVAIDAHKGEINDLSLCPKGMKILSLCRSLDAVTLWSFPQLKKLASLTWSPGNNVKYKTRAIKFAVIEGNWNRSRLFSLSNPAVRSNKFPSYLVKWDCPSYVASKSVITGKEDLCALAVSSDGDYVAVGTLAGSVSIYISFSLQKLYHIQESHSTFVTGLTFLSQRADSKYDSSLISVSADSRIKVYNVKKRLMVPFILVVILFAGCVALAFFVLDMLHL